MTFVRLMAHPSGRVARIIAGLAIMGIGLGVIGGTLGWIVAAVGLVPPLAGLVDVCLIAPVIHAPFSGKDSLRAASQK